jgi:hypothetical protein
MIGKASRNPCGTRMCLTCLLPCRVFLCTAIRRRRGIMQFVLGSDFASNRLLSDPSHEDQKLRTDEPPSSLRTSVSLWSRDRFLATQPCVLRLKHSHAYSGLVRGNDTSPSSICRSCRPVKSKDGFRGRVPSCRRVTASASAILSRLSPIQTLHSEIMEPCGIAELRLTPFA